MTAADKADELLARFQDPYKAWKHANKQYDRALDTDNEEKQTFWSDVGSSIFQRYASTIRMRLATRTRAR